jgi:hypothetical protein
MMQSLKIFFETNIIYPLHLQINNTPKSSNTIANPKRNGKQNKRAHAQAQEEPTYRFSENVAENKSWD